MDGTQTSESIEAGPGSPGHATASRRALDETAAKEGPLDLTIPLNIAEIRAALATTGPHLMKAKSAAPDAASASVASARPVPGRAAARHCGPKRLGRIAAFVAVAAVFSVGTAGALVLSDNTANQSVSLPASGAIPVAPSSSAPPSRAHSSGSGSTSAHAAPSLSHSVADLDPVSPDPAASRTASSPPATAGSPSSSASAASSASPSASSSISPPDSPVGTGWQTLYLGQAGGAAQAQETTDVQSLLNNVGYLEPWRHRTYVLAAVSSTYSAAPDPSGYYGSATADAIAEFQQDYSIEYSGALGECDLTTYDALIQIETASQNTQTAQ